MKCQECPYYVICDSKRYEKCKIRDDEMESESVKTSERLWQEHNEFNRKYN